MVKSAKPILWIDDDVRYLRPQVENLTDAGIVIEVEPDIDIARDKIINHRDNYVGFILDMMMSPGKSYLGKDHKGGLNTGLLVIEELKEKLILPEIRLVVLSNRHETNTVKRVRDLGISYDDKYKKAGMMILEFAREKFGV